MMMTMIMLLTKSETLRNTSSSRTWIWEWRWWWIKLRMILFLWSPLSRCSAERRLILENNPMPLTNTRPSVWEGFSTDSSCFSSDRFLTASPSQFLCYSWSTILRNWIWTQVKTNLQSVKFWSGVSIQYSGQVTAFFLLFSKIRTSYNYIFKQYLDILEQIPVTEKVSELCKSPYFLYNSFLKVTTTEMTTSTVATFLSDVWWFLHFNW